MPRRDSPVFKLRGDNGRQTGGLAVDSNLGWKGAEKYVATVPQIFDLWQALQERYDIFISNFTERTWIMVRIGGPVTRPMKAYVQYPPRKLQSMGYDGPIEISNEDLMQAATITASFLYHAAVRPKRLPRKPLLQAPNTSPPAPARVETQTEFMAKLH